MVLLETELSFSPLQKHRANSSNTNISWCWDSNTATPHISLFDISQEIGANSFFAFIFLLPVFILGCNVLIWDNLNLSDSSISCIGVLKHFLRAYLWLSFEIDFKLD